MCGLGSYDTGSVQDLCLCGTVTEGHTRHLEVSEMTLDTYMGAIEMSLSFSLYITGA